MLDCKKITKLTSQNGQIYVLGSLQHKQEYAIHKIKRTKRNPSVFSGNEQLVISDVGVNTAGVYVDSFAISDSYFR